MYSFLSTTIQHTKYTFMILQTGTCNYLFSKEQPGAIPTPALKMPAPLVIKQQCLTHTSLPSTPSTAISQPPALPHKKLPIPLSLQKQHLPDFSRHWERNASCVLPTGLGSATNVQSEESWDAVTTTLSKNLR